MLPCEDVRNLIEHHLEGTLDEPQRRKVVAHLRTCPICHRAVEEARLAAIILSEIKTPAPPPALANRIKHAALFRLAHPPRPLHQRALGSPAFLATCASVLCGAVICLIAIMRLNSVTPVTQAPLAAVVHGGAGPRIVVAPAVTTPLHRPLPIHREVVPGRANDRREARQPARPPRPVMAAVPRPAPRVRAAAASSVASRRRSAPVSSGYVRPALIAAAGGAIVPEASLAPAAARTSSPGAVTELVVPRPVPIEPDIHLMDLISPQPGIRGEFIRMDQ